MRVCVCVCVCYWALVCGLCLNYEVVDFQYQTMTPLKPRLVQMILYGDNTDVSGAGDREGGGLPPRKKWDGGRIRRGGGG